MMMTMMMTMMMMMILIVATAAAGCFAWVSLVLRFRTMLSVTLKGVCAQLLLPARGGKGRVPVNEILMGSFGLGNIIREGNVSKIISLIESGGGEGMQKMDDAILKRYNDSEISGNTAYLFATQKQSFEKLKEKLED